MKIAVIGPAHFGVAEPFAGGLEAHTSRLALGLHSAGHEVTVFAGHPESAQLPDLETRPILDAPIDFSASDRSDNAMPDGRCEAEDAAYRRLMFGLERHRFDIVHNNSLHYLVPGLASCVDIPIVHTLHCPPFPWLVDAHRRNKSQTGAVVAVSAALAALWPGLADGVILNGVPIPQIAETEDRLVAKKSAIWIGRLVPEKAPHLAIDAARLAGFTLDLFGPAQHPEYFANEVAPRLGPTVTWRGHCNQEVIVSAMLMAEVGVVTPEWDEPFGLTTAEMLAAGLPVAAFDRGATREILTPETGCLVRAGDVHELARALPIAARRTRSACRNHAAEQLSEQRMVNHYLQLYAALIDAGDEPRIGDPEALAAQLRRHRDTAN